MVRIVAHAWTMHPLGGEGLALTIKSSKYRLVRSIDDKTPPVMHLVRARLAGYRSAKWMLRPTYG